MNQDQIRERNIKIVGLGKQGITLADIGNRFGICKSSVYRVLQASDINPMTIRQATEQDDDNQRCIKRHGYTTAEMETLDSNMLRQARKAIHKIRNNSYRKGIEVTVRLCDIYPLMVDRCPVLNTIYTDKGDCGRSADRIDNTKGYIVGNIQFMSWRANRIKSDSTINELTLLLNYLNK